jgi:membrane fusion protein, copper/silver efflux system
VSDGGGTGRDPRRPLHDDTLPEGEEAAPPGVRAMALVRWTLVILMAVVATASVLHYTGILRPQGSATAAVQYYCPMHPSVVQDQPGECPICGMTLVARDASAAPSGQFSSGAAPSVATDGGTSIPNLVTVTLPPERVQLMGIRTAPVTRGARGAELRAVGYVTVDEAAVTQVHTRVAGWIQTLQVARTGEQVRRGDVLATIYSPALLTTQQELLAARRFVRTGGGGSSFDVAAGTDPAALQRSIVDGARRRLELFGVAPEEIRTLERTGQPLAAVPLRAPRDGYVTEKSAVQGAYVQPETTLFQIADLARVWVLAEVYESELTRVDVGAPATLTLAAYPGVRFPGTVDYLYPTLDPATRTVRVRLIFANADLRLRPGMFGDVVLALPPTDDLMVPREAVVDTGERTYVFVVHEGGHFEPRLVRIGARSGDAVAVQDGLAEGEVVVTTANFLVDSESRLRAAISGMGGHVHDATPPAPR